MLDRFAKTAITRKANRRRMLADNPLVPSATGADDLGAFVGLPIYRRPDLLAKVDADVFEWIKFFRWRVVAGKYIGATIDTVNASLHVLIMGRLGILRDDDHLDVDHINGNKIDNRRGNLRVTSRSRNMCNTGKVAGLSSKYKGVYYKASTDRWFAQGRFQDVDGNRVQLLKQCYTELEAAKLYDAMVLKHVGPDGWLNFPPPGKIQFGVGGNHGS